MKERPIIFSAEMVRAILDGRKTQTRRAIKPQPTGGVLGLRWDHDMGKPSWIDPHGCPVKCPYGRPGDRLWVREAFGFSRQDDDINEVERVVCYKAGAPWYSILNDKSESLVHSGYGRKVQPNHFVHHPARWKSSIHMPRWASRITLEIKSVRVERLQDISESDARAEGVRRNWTGDDLKGFAGTRDYNEGLDGWYRYGASEDEPPCETARESFDTLWESIKGPGSWDANPWVWVIEFQRIKSNAPDQPAP
jgi:hypothetical protein